MKKPLSVLSLFLVIVVLLSISILAEESCLYYFYGDDCEGCKVTTDFVSGLEEKYIDLQLERYEVHFNQDNAALLNSYYASYRVPKEAQGLPVVFTEGSYFIGQQSITELIEGRINEGSNCPVLEDSAVIGLLGRSEPKDVLQTLTFAAVTSSGLKDSLRPGALAVILILFMLLVTIKDKEHLLRKGVLFVVGSFGALLGVGFLMKLTNPAVSVLFPKVFGIGAIVVGVGMIMHAGGAWEPLVKNLPESLRKNVKEGEEILMSSGSFLIISFLGGIMAAGTLGKTFTILQSLVKAEPARLAALPSLLYYFFVLLVPAGMIVALLVGIRTHIGKKAAKKGTSEKNAESWEQHYHTTLQFSVSLLLIVVGLVLVFV